MKKRLALDLLVRKAYSLGLRARTCPADLGPAHREAWWLGNDYREGRIKQEMHTGDDGCGCASCRLACIVEKYLDKTG